ncbi:hypothetical protein OSB04_024335 [Centaurea solstitialis]|uniref:Uncharacterized protein n=1 Tax=Centaurea solstitialis TaxID=347529 RepID=A0AA38T5E5_9ASTR|nr:hypothetical protein OSB04_024335 [Centaurea solstitialis]
MPKNFQLNADSSGKPVDQKTYWANIGSLLYLTASRPDIVFSTGVCARFQCDPRDSHLSAVKRILRYLKGTSDFGLWYPKDSGFELIPYIDSDHTGCKLNRKSTSGACQFLGEKLVSWSSGNRIASLYPLRRQNVAAACCCSQVLWMKTQLTDFGYTMQRIPIYCDSKSAIQITANPVQHSRTKHIDIRYHFIKDHVEKGTVELYFVESDYQLADLFPKPFDENRHFFLLRGVFECLHESRGSVVSIFACYANVLGSTIPWIPLCTYFGKCGYSQRLLVNSDQNSHKTQLRRNRFSESSLEAHIFQLKSFPIRKTWNYPYGFPRKHVFRIGKLTFVYMILSDSENTKYPLLGFREMARQQNSPPSPINNAVDRALITREQLRPIIQKNEFIDLMNVVVQDDVVLEILKVHPVANAMQSTADVPLIYVQQFWVTSHVETRDDVLTLVGRVDQTEMTVTLEDVRRILHLPAATPESLFEPLVSGPELFSEILALGVSANPTQRLNGISHVTQGMLPPLWFTLFNLVNRCLSSKTHGVDRASTHMWHVIHSISYGRRVDVMQQLWLDIVNDAVEGPARTRHSSIPWMRFISLMIRDHMDSNQTVRRRSGHPRFQSKQINRTNQHTINTEA